ncbi:amidohydrolase [Reichenbachiella carrageenanivorans]|uniref:Amidohydrolase n=1 Tax=Reichenbachiella carrageenanivorans TaxID=2979869 RepID=A0ABY6CZY9_9BACT|nr:amidohydrolase [Reichenbachiella carrageenanivorans]UXX79009.1 amidohydrolase [Reichenbachiella carrageenanivorans]
MKTKFLIMTILIAIVFICCNQTKKETSVVEKTATIYYNGDIITMESDEPTYAEAVVEENGKIVFVGNKDEASENYNKANQVDLEGKTMLPAFLDGHGHFYNVGFTAMCANILPPPDGPGVDFNSVVETLNEYKETETGKYVLEKLGWIIGNGYDDSQLAEKDHPKASDLDKVSTDLPVIIIHQSGHLASINSKGLELMGYTANTPNPDGGVIRKDSNGNPNGVLEEAAFFKVLFPVLGKIDDDMAAKCIKQGQDEYAKKGYLTAQDGRTTTDQLAALRKAADEQAYYIDVVAYPDMTLGIEQVAEGTYTPTHQYKNKFRLGGVKLTLDGSPQGKTAWLTKCYHVNPEGRTGCYEGYPIMDDDKATEYVKTAFKNKWQILCHSNGDAAIDQYIKAVGAAEKEFGYLDHRTVLIHGQTLRKDQIPELVELSILPSLFPMHTFYWGDWHKESVLGEPRADYISPCRDVIDAGLTITSHHDAPVTFPNSMRVLDATVNRVTRSGKVLGADQRITVYEGLKTLTDWAAFQYFEEGRKGTLTVGKLADFVILDKNPLKIDPIQIHDIQVLESIKEGKKVYELE